MIEPCLYGIAIVCGFILGLLPYIWTSRQFKSDAMFLIETLQLNKNHDQTAYDLTDAERILQEYIE